MTQKTVLITGCSTGGIGHALAQSFARNGYTVFASARDTTKLATLADNPRIYPLVLDVTNPADITKAVAEVREVTGGTLDVLVNNAGRQHVAPLLEVDLAHAKETFEVNFWAYFALVQACATMLMATSGTIINVSSVGAIMNTPFIGIYNSSKAAVTSLSETLRLELKPFGIRVVTVMAGAVGTNLQRGASNGQPLSADSLYLAAQDDVLEIASTGKVATPTPVQIFADTVVRDVLRGHTGYLWRGYMSTFLMIIATFLPSFVHDFVTFYGSGANKVSGPKDKTR